MRRGFTLIELLAIIAIMAAMVAVSVASVRSGQVAARTRGAARDIYATIRHARSSALVTQQPAIITYSTEMVDGEACARIRIDGAKILNTAKAAEAFTLGGERVEMRADDDGGEGGDAVEDVLFAPLSDEVVKGIRLKVLKDGEELVEAETSETGRNKISVFSNVDYLLGRFADKEAKDAGQRAETSPKPETADAQAADDLQEPVSVVWEVNGRTEPHRVYVYQDGSRPEKGLCIKVDRFGTAKVLAAGEDD